MAIDRLVIFEDLELRPTLESRAALSDLGMSDQENQDSFYEEMASGLGAVERARRAEHAAAAALRAEYLASVADDI